MHVVITCFTNCGLQQSFNSETNVSHGPTVSPGTPTLALLAVHCGVHPMSSVALKKNRTFVGPIVDGNQRWAPGFMNKYETVYLSCLNRGWKSSRGHLGRVQYSNGLYDFMKVGIPEWIDFFQFVFYSEYLDFCGTGLCLNQTCMECPLLRHTGPNRIEKLPDIQQKVAEGPCNRSFGAVASTLRVR